MDYQGETGLHRYVRRSRLGPPCFLLEGRSKCFVTVGCRFKLRAVVSQALSSFSRLSSNILLVPILTNVMKPLKCEKTWAGTSWKCGDGQHLALIVAALLCLLVFVVLVMIGAHHCNTAST